MKTRAQTKRNISNTQWADLPKELLEIIADHLHTKTDITRLRSVCKSWRFSILPCHNTLVLPPQVAYLGPRHLPQTPLFLTESTVFYVSLPAGSISSSSSLWGWLVKLKEGQQQGQHHLINPLTPLQIQSLPDSVPRVINSLQFRVFELAKSYTLQYSNLNQCNYKVVLNPNPDCPSLMIVASGVLWHLKLGHDRWIAIEDMISQLSYKDVILYEGKFCAVDECGRTVLIDSSLNINEIVPESSTEPLSSKRDGDKKKLVLSNEGELLLVIIIKYLPWLDVPKSVPKFRIFKLEIDQQRWVEVCSLNDQILFLGEDCSFSVSAQNFSGCKGNCIIYTDARVNVYNLNDHSISPITQHPKYMNIFYPPSWAMSGQRPRFREAQRQFFNQVN